MNYLADLNGEQRRAVEHGITSKFADDGRGLMVVGDDAQSVYSFHAATVRNILDFPDQFEPKARVVTLEQNYRSTQPILDACNAVIGLAKERFTKNLRSDRRSRQKPILTTVMDEAAQARHVAEDILAAREAGTPLKSLAGIGASQVLSQRPRRPHAMALRQQDCMIKIIDAIQWGKSAKTEVPVGPEHGKCGPQIGGQRRRLVSHAIERLRGKSRLRDQCHIDVTVAPAESTMGKAADQVCSEQRAAQCRAPTASMGRDDGQNRPPRRCFFVSRAMGVAPVISA